MAGQSTRKYEAKDETMNQYQEVVQRRLAELDEVHFQQIPREENVKADTLAKLGSIPLAKLGKEIYVDQLNTPSITRGIVMEIEIVPCWMDRWMDPIKIYL